MNAGDSFTYKTQKGVKYMGNTDCTVNYKLGDSCDRMSFICNKVNIESTDQNCNNGDSLVVSSKAKEKRYNFLTTHYLKHPDLFPLTCDLIPVVVDAGKDVFHLRMNFLINFIKYNSRICKKKKLRVVSDQDLTAVFTSDSTGHSTGAECKAVCSGEKKKLTVQSVIIIITHTFTENFCIDFYDCEYYRQWNTIYCNQQYW